MQLKQVLLPAASAEPRVVQLSSNVRVSANCYGKSCCVQTINVRLFNETGQPICVAIQRFHSVLLHDTLTVNVLDMYKINDAWNECFRRIFTSATLDSCRRMSVCPSVRPSITSRCSTETTKRSITQTTPHDSAVSLVF